MSREHQHHLEGYTPEVQRAAQNLWRFLRLEACFDDKPNALIRITHWDQTSGDETVCFLKQRNVMRAIKNRIHATLGELERAGYAHVAEDVIDQFSREQKEHEAQGGR